MIMPSRPDPPIFDNGISPAQAERLHKLAEECSELAAIIIMKTLRHGMDSYHPDDPSKVSNQQLIEGEMGDLFLAIGVCAGRGDLDINRAGDAAEQKKPQYTRYMHHDENRNIDDIELV